VTARFDAQAMDFLFDLRFTPAMPQQLVPLDFGFDLSPVGDFSAKGKLVLNAGIDFVTTIGLDFNRPENFTAVGGTVSKAELVGKASAGVANVGRVLFNQGAAYNATTNPAVDAKFTIDIDGERYALTLTAASQADNNSVEDLLADLNALLDSTAVKANGKLAVVGYDKLGQAARFALVDVAGKKQLQLNLYGTGLLEVSLSGQAASVTVGSETKSINAAADVLGLTGSKKIAAVPVAAPADGKLSDSIAFDLIINGADDKSSAGMTTTTKDNAITVAVNKSAFANNTSVDNLADDIQAALNAITTLGPLEGTVTASGKVISNLGEVLKVKVLTKGTGKVIVFVTQEKVISTLSFRVADTDPLVRQLGIQPGTVYKSGGVSLFLQDTLLGGKIVAGVEDFSATGKLGFVSVSMDQMKAAIDAGVNVQMRQPQRQPARLAG